MSDEDITLALSTLVYQEGIDVFQYDSIYDAVVELKNIQDKNYVKGDIITNRADGNQYMTDAEWYSFYNYILKHKNTFSKLTIENISYDYGMIAKADKDKKKVDKQMIVTSSDKAYIIYRGTGNLEWHDNADGIHSNTILSKQQQTAIDYYQKGKILVNDKKIVIGGHSKGGNKASIIGYLYGDEISHAYSFDGQGLSASFYKAYLKQIRKNKDKVTSIAAQNDYVNILGIRIKETKYTGYNKKFLKFFTLGTMTNTWGQSIHEALAQHAPYAMYDSSYSADVGGIAKRRKTDGQQDVTLHMLSNLVQYAMLNMRDDDFEYLSHSIMHLLDAENCSVDFDPTIMPVGFMERAKVVFKDFGQFRLGLRSDKLNKFVTSIENSIEVFSKGHLLFQIIGGKHLYTNFMNFLNDNAPNVISTDTKRDYTQETQDIFIKLVSEVEDENPWDFTKWDIWTRLEDSHSKITLESCNNDINAYYRKLVDIRDTTKKSATEIFDNVYKRDKTFCKDLTTLNNNLDEINHTLGNLTEKLAIQ